MSNIHSFCVFCSKKGGKLNLFDANKITKCIPILKIRKNAGLSFSNVVLPKEPNTFQVYHSQCHSRFTALPPKQRGYDPYKQVPSTSRSIDAMEEEHAVGTEGDSEDEGREEAAVQGEGEVDVEYDNVEPEHVDTDDHVAAGEEANVDDVNVSGIAQEVSHNPICLFCDKNRKKHQGREQPMHVLEKAEALSNIQEIAMNLEDIQFVQKLHNLSIEEKYIFYHAICRKKYENTVSSKKSKEKPKSQWHIARDIHSRAYREVCEFVTENIIIKNQSYFLSFLNAIFIEYLERHEANTDAYTMKSYHLENRLLATFSKKITVVSHNNKKLVKPYKGVVVQKEFDLIEKEEVLFHAALILRQEIQNVKRRQLPDQLNSTDLIRGECDIPQSLIDFYLNLLSGPNYRRKRGENGNRLAKSFSEDIIYAVTNGRIKPSKHICLGLSLKSLTNSKKIVNIINRYGHCCSYTSLEGIETEATFTSSIRSDICPEGIIRSGNLCTGVAFDNFDRFVDTSSGHDTLHDTVGIIFQNIDNSIEQDDEDTRAVRSTAGSSEKSNKRRRTFDTITHELEPYNKRPKLHERLQPASDVSSNLSNSSSEWLKQINFAFMLSHYLQIPETPMWVGFNSLIYKDTAPTQKLCYLTTINASPTDKSVVLETMKQSQQVARECGEKYMQVTYDLAITKIALQIQCTEKPRYDNLFIHVGSIHIMMSYFKAVGKFIDNCGVTTVMVNAQMLANGSVNSFITGKHFNRCKRLHPMASLALQIIHFEEFLNRENIECSDDMKIYLTQFKEERSDQPRVLPRNLQDLFDKYQQFKQQTLQGDLGKTPQFYMMYVTFIDYYLTLNASVRSGNLQLFTSILSKIANLCFAFNQQNYSRYLVKYQDNLLKVDQTHPGLKKQLEMGTFGVKRTDKPNSRQPVDLTSEQTINADAANKLTGVSHMTNSISARQRWCKSHTLRSTIISHTMDQTGLRKVQDITADLQKSRITKNSQQVHNFIDNIKQNIDPFSADLDKNYLFNISTGQTVQENIERFLLNVEIMGNEQRDNFIKECVEDENRFEKPIKRNKVLNFTDNMQKKKIPVSGKVVELRMQRDLFGQFLCISLKKSLDIEKVLIYPLTPVPLSMCHIDGTICKTNKAALLKILEQQVEPHIPKQTNVKVFDGFFMLHLMREIPATYGNISTKILSMFCSNDAEVVVIAFDRYIFPSIKDSEHSLRGMQVTQFHIEGADQIRSSDFSNDLKNAKFKEALVNFIIQHWALDSAAPFIGNKTIFINYDQCYKYKVNNGHVERTHDVSSTCPAHEEADTKIVFHVCQIDYDAHVTIRCSDTDVAVIMLSNMSALSNANVKVSMEAGVGNNQRFINISKLYETLGPKLSAALPAFHALTGCDYNPSFFKKGKNRPYKILHSSEIYIEHFIKLSNAPDDELENTFNTTEEYVCRMYGFKKINKVNEARVETFLKTYNISQNDDIFRLPKNNIDGSALPPCKIELHQHLLRTTYIANIWAHAHLQVPTALHPTDFGWKEKEGKFHFKWFEGEQLPSSLGDITINEDQTSPTDDNEDISWISINCSDHESDDGNDDDESEGSEI
ncbi:unnamed protein product [Phaedon cochleariae]|uniref:Uncharacterized protein n=1 Tax=Phaedon cochleariae TaxID=80249 RepID=A0A9P0DN48_PHACE|nr:unnamed protein product [Phaedon cochleariae]